MLTERDKLIIECAADREEDLLDGDPRTRVLTPGEQSRQVERDNRILAKAWYREEAGRRP